MQSRGRRGPVAQYLQGVPHGTHSHTATHTHTHEGLSPTGRAQPRREGGTCRLGVPAGPFGTHGTGKRVGGTGAAFI